MYERIMEELKRMGFESPMLHQNREKCRISALFSCF